MLATMASESCEVMAASPGFLTEHYKLTGKVCKQEVSDRHLEEITCEQWRKLPPYLDLEATILNDLERDFRTEEERRVGLLKKWKGRKGFDATYIALISALLEIKCRNDAENICKLLLREPLTAAASSCSKQSEAVSQFEASSAAGEFCRSWGHRYIASDTVQRCQVLCFQMRVLKFEF